MPEEFSDVDSFLKHRSGSGGGGKFMKGWKDNVDANHGRLPVWLHTRRLPVSVWHVQFPRLQIKEDQVTRVTTQKFFMSNWVSWESDATHSRQYNRKADGTMEHPYRRDPICKMLEEVYQAVRAGELTMFDEVFRFIGSTDPKNDIVLHAGGMLGLWKPEKMNDAQKKEFADRGFHFQGPAGVWKEKCMPKNDYVFCLVKNDDVAAGLQVTTETGLLGQKVQTMINDEIARNKATNPALGDPFKNPYCVEFVYDKNADMMNKYHARVVGYPLTDEIRKLITSDPPDINRFLDPYIRDSMLAMMQRHAVVDFDWDYIARDEDAKAASAQVPASVDFPHGANAPAAESTGSPIPSGAATGAPTEPCPGPEGGPECNYPLLASDLQCPRCRTTFDPPGAEEAAPPPPQAPQAAPAQAPPPTSLPQASPPQTGAQALPSGERKAIGGKRRGGAGADPKKKSDPY